MVVSVLKYNEIHTQESGSYTIYTYNTKDNSTI